MRKPRSAAGTPSGTVGSPQAAPRPSEAPTAAPRMPWEQGMNDEQQAVINHVTGPLFVPAQAGTGKTRALVNRIARLVCVEGVLPERILAVTFSRKGAEEMNTRLRRDLNINQARVGTWHGLALQIMKEDMMTQSDWAIDEKNRFKFHVKDALGWKYHDWKGSDLTKVLGFIGFCKANLWDFDSTEAFAFATKLFGSMARKACAVFQTADELTHGAGLLTFDDMLVFVARHLQVEENAATWSGRWDHLLQDEAQDANVVQMTIAHALASGHRNYMIVGDPAQSIYAFRGSSPAHFMAFDQEWAAHTVYLNRNYRSGDAIVRAANDIIRLAEIKLPVDMIPMRGIEGKVQVVCGDTLDEEARSFVQWVQQHVVEGQDYSACTALFRTNAQSRALEEALLSQRIPYVVVGGTSFYERKEIKDLLGYLRVATDRDMTGEAVKRCINAPFRFLGAKFVDKVMDLARPGCEWTLVVDEAARFSGIQRRQQASAHEWCQLVANVQNAVNEGSEHDARPATILTELVQRTRFIEWLEKDEGEESIENSSGANVRELIRVSERFATVKELLDFIDRSIAEQAKQRKGDLGNRVLLMSIHRSKGLEWPNVWVVGCNEAILPHARGDIKEERRLMYVAVTRARDELVLSWVLKMATKAGMRTMEPSRFLSDANLNVSIPGYDPEPEQPSEPTIPVMGDSIKDRLAQLL